MPPLLTPTPEDSWDDWPGPAVTPNPVLAQDSMGPQRYAAWPQATPHSPVVVARRDHGIVIEILASKTEAPGPPDRTKRVDSVDGLTPSHQASRVPLAPSEYGHPVSPPPYHCVDARAMESTSSQLAPGDERFDIRRLHTDTATPLATFSISTASSTSDAHTKNRSATNPHERSIAM